jgi:hypothetical protein
VSGTDLRWYLRRLSRMSASEVAWRTVDQTRRRTWSRYQVHRETPAPVVDGVRRRFEAVLPAGALDGVGADLRQAVERAADAVLDGRWTVLGVPRTDASDPDWFYDPVTGRRAPDTAYCFSIDHRSEELTGNVKQVWEMSRMHHVTVLAAAYAFSGDDRYAETAARQLRSWWAQNPFLSGIHWTNGIEVGQRLIAWVWIRRLLDAWPGAAALFEENPEALSQIRWHQRYLAAFRSRGSSANNHVIAEAAGQLVGALAFPWFDQSGRWATQAAALLERELQNNTFPSGVNRELAFDYHGFVAELAIIAAVEADRAGRPLSDQTWQCIGSMLDVVAALVDSQLGAPRQGDGDDGRGLVLGPADANRWSSLLAFGSSVFGAPDWWPPCPQDATSLLLDSLAARHKPGERSPARPNHFPDAGVTILRSATDGLPEIWCRCDSGPHGFLSIAAHAHADAMAIEVRHGGTDILSDPGTFCYHGDERWRSYFRSTLAHNTIELGGLSQSTQGGPFLWTRHAQTRLLQLEHGPDGAEVWSAEHDGYAVLDPPAVHRRTVRFLEAQRRIEVSDVIESAGRHRLRLMFHLGPEVAAALDGSSAALTWTTREGSVGRATLDLPPELTWSTAGGLTDPVLGWYSARFGEKQPSVSLVGEGTSGSGTLVSTLVFYS